MKKSIDDMKEEHKNDIRLYTLLKNGEYHIAFNLMNVNITKDIVELIKKKCRGISRPKDAKALCLKLGIPDLKVAT